MKAEGWRTKKCRGAARFIPHPSSLVLRLCGFVHLWRPVCRALCQAGALGLGGERPEEKQRQVNEKGTRWGARWFITYAGRGGR
jgi:hypothetical protein